MKKALATPGTALLKDAMIFRSDSTRLKRRKTRKARIIRNKPAQRCYLAGLKDVSEEI